MPRGPRDLRPELGQLRVQRTQTAGMRGFYIRPQSGVGRVSVLGKVILAWVASELLAWS